MTSRFYLILKTSFRLGFRSVARVTAYRVACRSGFYRYLLPQRGWNIGGTFFAPGAFAAAPFPEAQRRLVLERASSILAGKLPYYSSSVKQVGSPPDWFFDPFAGTRLLPHGHWSDCGVKPGGDIKNVWEASRFEWAPVLALAWRVSGEEKYLSTLNAWVSDWAEKNPFNSGPNWKCGQEASIRLINLLLAARVLGVHDAPSSSLVEFITLHCSRIMPTIHYAVGQDNNHGTSEAAALFIGGGWLIKVAGTAALKRRAARWHQQGRRRLEERVSRLVAPDGSFSQYSINYHRVLLDTLSQAEIWRRELDAPSFSSFFHARCKSAAAWLEAMTDALTGDAPNLGANDGARLYDLFSAPYRDFRPSVELAYLLFRGERVYGKGEWDAPLRLLGVEPDAHPCSKESPACQFPAGGYVVLHSGASRGVIRYANFVFRPGHADCLHLDLWHKGVNILRDGGTFSYSADPSWHDYFSGTQAHNTVQFDGRNQMPRVGRFLFGEWLEMEKVSEMADDGAVRSWSGAYRDWKGARHRRTVAAQGNVWRIRDEVSGFEEKAVLRWRLVPAGWVLNGGSCESEHALLSVAASAPLRRLELTTGWESLHYQEKTPLPVLEIEIGAGTWSIDTEITLKD